MSTSHHRPTVCALLSLCLLHVCICVNNATTEQANSSDAVTEGVSDGYPNPWQDPERCRRTGSEKSWICDADGVLPKEQAEVIESLLQSVNSNASCVCNCSNNATFEFADEGYVLAVAVVRMLPEEDLSNGSWTYHLERFSDSVRHDWFDDRICDDSALILAHYMYNCSKIHISLGDALASILPDQALSLIYEAAQPSLDTGDLGQAIITTIQKTSSAIDEALNTTTEPPPPNNLVWGILGVITVSSILLFHYWIKY